MKTGHVAIVLAAGGSRRLGQPKQLLTREGETLVHRAVRLALSTRPRRLLLVCGAHADAVRAAVAGLEAEVLLNHAWEEGIASSLRLAAGALKETDAPCLILGCDQPALEHAHLQALLTGAATASSCCAATSHEDARGIPAVTSATMLREAHDMSGDHGLRGSLQRLARESIYLLDAPELHFDLDTPADAEQAMVEGLLDPFAKLPSL